MKSCGDFREERFVKHASRQRGPMLARGFTLVEMSATLAVLIILSALAAVSMSSTLANNRTYAAQDEFIAYLAYARSEAIRRRSTVVIGATAPVSGNAFGGGWSVWVDANGNGTRDAGETVLRSHEAVPNIVLGDGTVQAIVFTPMGFLTPTTAVDIKVCPTDPTLAGFDIVVQPSGLTDVAEVTAGSSPCSGS
jgi:type IV fimbrial biogenesis protein FimT